MPLDRRTDVYQLGVTLFEMLTFELPAPDTRPSVQKYNPNLPSDCDQVIAHALAQNKEERYPTASAFARAFAAIVAHQQVPPTQCFEPAPITYHPWKGQKFPDSSPPRPSPHRPIAQRGPKRWSVVLAMALLLTVFGLLVGQFVIGSPANIGSTTQPAATVALSSSTVELLGQIAFTAYQNEKLTLYLTNGAKTQSLNITGSSPTLSPDGNQIAFVSDRSGTNELYVISATGGSPTRLSDSLEQIESPAWSVLGSQLAFIAGEGILYTVDPLGTQIQPLTNAEIGQVTHFAWSPDAQALLFDAQQAGERRIYRLNADGSAVQQLTDFDSWAPSWSPDGTTIALSSERGIHTMNHEGQEQRRLTTSRAWNPSWSPDGNHIAYLSDRGDNNLNPELSLMDTDGRNQARLTTSGCWAYTWAPHHNKLAYITGNIQTQPPALTFWVLNVETGEKMQIAEVNEPHVSWIDGGR